MLLVLGFKLRSNGDGGTRLSGTWRFTGVTPFMQTGIIAFCPNKFSVPATSLAELLVHNLLVVVFLITLCFEAEIESEFSFFVAEAWIAQTLLNSFTPASLGCLH